MDLWESSYNTRRFVRWTIIDNDSRESVGTIEMFGRGPDQVLGRYGILRIDLRSDFETQHVISDILELAAKHFYDAFDVDAILTKAVPAAGVRIETLSDAGYRPLEGNLIKYGDYYIRKR
jgi:RimJ/RimL family protein N-acetyltransferase